jgi:hypothetical protein
MPVVIGATTLPKILKGYYATQVRKRNEDPVLRRSSIKGLMG